MLFPLQLGTDRGRMFASAAQVVFEMLLLRAINCSDFPIYVIRVFTIDHFNKLYQENEEY